MISPKYLQKGDTVAIVSPARKITINDIQPSVSLLESWGLNVVVGKTIGLEDHQFAGSDAQRTLDLQTMLNRQDIDAIWCARGGYGTVRIIDQLDFSSFKDQPKWIIGYSDITVLHNHLHNMGFKSIHATMPLDVSKNTDRALESLKDTLFGTSVHYSISASRENRKGKATGKLIGGNLSMLYSLLGSKTSIDTKGNILFIEDLDEYLYHIDRMLQNIKRNGYFDQLAGLIVGAMSDMHDNTVPFGKNAKEIILDIVSTYSFPVIFDFPAGHLNDNSSLILGSEASMEVTGNHADLYFEKD